jgi:hypothetical protein
MAPPLRSIVICPKKKKKTYVFAKTGYLGMPGTGMKTMTPEQWRKWSANTDMKIVMRPNASSRLSRIPAMRALVDPMYNENRQMPCGCSRARYRKRVRFISLDSYEIDYFGYCQCAAACSGLIAEGFFPSSSPRLGTVFSLRLLRTLHAQSVLGSVSKQAWSAGFQMIFEEDLKTVLPRFNDEVCIYRERAIFAIVRTDVASGCLPSLAGCTVHVCILPGWQRPAQLVEKQSWA